MKAKVNKTFLKKLPWGPGDEGAIIKAVVGKVVWKKVKWNSFYSKPIIRSAMGFFSSRASINQKNPCHLFSIEIGYSYWYECECITQHQLQQRKQQKKTLHKFFFSHLIKRNRLSRFSFWRYIMRLLYIHIELIACQTARV